jgi:breast cancer metastasis-suppressor 1-like protein
MDSIKESLNEKIRRLEEDRNQVGLLECDPFLKSRSLLSFSGSGVFRGDDNRGQESREKDKRRKPITVTGPYIVYMLSDADIMEDWTMIRKALTATKRKDCKFNSRVK